MNIKKIVGKRFMRCFSKKKMNIAVSLLLIIVLSALLAINIGYNITHYTTEFYKISSNKISEKIRIVFLTDLHQREYGDGNSELLRDIKNLAPDLILIGGDMVTESNDEYSHIITLYSNLSRIAPTYGVWGNHEDVKLYIQNDKALAEEIKKSGVRMLTNEAETIELKGNSVSVCGIDGSSANFEKYGAKQVAERFDGYYGFKIMLCHVPTYFNDKLAEYDFDLGLAGHTHGGIIKIPKIGALYSAEEGLFPKFASGQFMLKNGAELIISRGLGHSAPIPRINNIPELSIIDIE